MRQRMRMCPYEADLAGAQEADDLHFPQQSEHTEHTYLGRDFPPPTPAHLSARLVPTQLQPTLLLSVTSGESLSRRPGSCGRVPIQMGCLPGP